MVRVAGDKRLVVRKRYLWKTFEQIVAVAFFWKPATAGVLWEKNAVENLANFTGKYISWSPYLINLQAWGPEAFLKRDSNTSIFPVKFAKFVNLCIFRSFYLQCMKKI